MSSATMAPAGQAPVKKVDPMAEGGVQRIRITLTSLNVQAVEKVCTTFKNAALERGQKVKGPVRMPTKHLQLAVRKSPCGNGTQTFDRFSMRIYKRIIDLDTQQDMVKQITAVSIEPGVDIVVHYL